MEKIVAVIFDMDGVIIDSNPTHKIALQQFCHKYGFHLTDEELLSRVYGRTNNEWITNLFGRELTDRELNDLGEEKEMIFRELYKDIIKPLDGLQSFLEQLDAHDIPRAIGTSAPRSNVDFVLKHTGLEKFFTIILDQSDVKHGKPDPEIYLKVAARLKLPPAQCIVFEDSLSGIISAQKAGTRVVGVATTHTLRELSHTNLAIKDFVGLDPLTLIGSLFRE